MVMVILVLFMSVTTVIGRNNASSESFNQYEPVKVVAGDTVWDIASANIPAGMDVRKAVYDICDINGISADELQAGQTILVPVYE